MSGPELGLALSVFAGLRRRGGRGADDHARRRPTRSWSSAPRASVPRGRARRDRRRARPGADVAADRRPAGRRRRPAPVFGLQWLRKAILRASGLKALHDEAATFAEEREAARAAGRAAAGFDPYAFTIAFKGVLLEGLEVAFIVLTFGANQHRIPLAALAAGRRSSSWPPPASRCARRWRACPRTR